MSQSTTNAKQVRRINLNDQPSDFSYWQSQPIEARLSMMEEIRREYHTWKGDGEEPSSLMLNNQDFKDFIIALNDQGVSYLIIGGYAVAFHGHPRYTKDLDVWVWPEQKNAEKLIAALEQFGFGALGLQPADFIEPDQIVQLGYPPNRIDIITTLTGVDIESCYAAKIEVAIEGTVVNFIDLENLKKNKKASGRHQDLADLENLE